MSLRRRLVQAERRAAEQISIDEPVTLLECLNGGRDEPTRRRLGPAGCKEAARKIREWAAKLTGLDDPATDLSSEEVG